MSGIPASSAPLAILDPAHGQIQFAIQEGVAFRAGVSEEHPDLAIFQVARRAAMLPGHPCGLFATLAKTRFVDHQDRVRITQALQDVGTQIIAHQVCIPDRAVEQALHPIGAALSGVFGELPPIFPFDGTHDAFEVRQGSPTRFRSEQNEGRCGHAGVRVPAPTSRLRQRWFVLPLG